MEEATKKERVCASNLSELLVCPSCKREITRGYFVIDGSTGKEDIRCQCHDMMMDYIDETPRHTVSREMAIDACDPSLEGQPI